MFLYLHKLLQKHAKTKESEPKQIWTRLLHQTLKNIGLAFKTSEPWGPL